MEFEESDVRQTQTCRTEPSQAKPCFVLRCVALRCFALRLLVCITDVSEQGPFKSILVSFGLGCPLTLLALTTHTHDCDFHVGGGFFFSY